MMSPKRWEEIIKGNATRDPDSLFTRTEYEELIAEIDMLRVANKFQHKVMSDDRDELREKLAVAVEALDNIRTSSGQHVPINPITLAIEALAKIRGDL